MTVSAVLKPNADGRMQGPNTLIVTDDKTEARKAHDTRLPRAVQETTP